MNYELDNIHRSLIQIQFNKLNLFKKIILDNHAWNLLDSRCRHSRENSILDRDDQQPDQFIIHSLFVAFRHSTRKQSSGLGATWSNKQNNNRIIRLSGGQCS